MSTAVPLKSVTGGEPAADNRRTGADLLFRSGREDTIHSGCEDGRVPERRRAPKRKSACLYPDARSAPMWKKPSTLACAALSACLCATGMPAADSIVPLNLRRKSP